MGHNHSQSNFCIFHFSQPYYMLYCQPLQFKHPMLESTNNKALCYAISISSFLLVFVVHTFSLAICDLCSSDWETKCFNHIHFYILFPMNKWNCLCLYWRYLCYKNSEHFFIYINLLNIYKLLWCVILFMKMLDKATILHHNETPLHILIRLWTPAVSSWNN